MDSKELLRKRAKVVADARALTDVASKENRSLTPEERQKFDALEKEALGLSEDIATRQRLTELEATVMADGERSGEPLPHQKESRHKYSVLRAIRLAADQRRVDGLEGEVSAELAKRRGREVRGNGFLLPLDLPTIVEDRAAIRQAWEQRVGVLNTAAGTGSIPTILDTTFIQLLRARLVVRQAGATVLADMQGNFAIPRQNQAGTMYWVAESASPAASNQTIDQVPFSPKTAGAFTDISRRFAEQTNLDAENFVRQDLTSVVARGVDIAALTGTGSANQPIGVINTAGVPVVAIGANGGPFTWAAAVSLESALAIANADVGNLAYITNASTRGSLRTTTQIGASTFPVYLWQAITDMYPVFVSNAIPNNLTKGTGVGLSAMFFGNWSDLIMAFWSGMDVIVDPYTGSTSGTLRIVVLQDVDINVRHPESFSVCKDIATT
jgi:HK97 family phage major capsid protein